MSPGNPRLTLVVDDHAESREWMTRAAKQAFTETEVVAAGSLREARVAIRAAVPELALVDLDLPDGSGVELIEQLSRSRPATVCVVTTVFADDLHVFPALHAGAVGYVLKDDSLEQLASFLAGMVHGTPALSPPIARRLLGYFHARHDEAIEALSPREREVLTLLAKGLTINRVAEVLGIAPTTAASYAKTLYRKLDVTNRAEATLEAARRGLIEP